MKYSTVIVIPVSRSPLTWFEKISLEQVHAVLKNYTICFLVPNKADIPWLDMYSDDEIEEFGENFFGSAYAHNRLLLTKEFYQRFLEYDFLLLYHLDAFIFYDKLQYFCSLGYDYIASPHPEHTVVIGGKAICDGLHGGFALRRVSAFLKALEEQGDTLDEWYGQEDCFFSWYAQKSSTIKKAPKEIALQFSFETGVRKMYRRNHYALPMGTHAWWKRDFAFYRSFIEERGYFIPQQLEYMVQDSLDHIFRKRKIREYLFQRTLREEKKQWWIKKYLRENFGETRAFALWGAGLDGHKFYACIHRLCDVVMCIDSDCDKWGKPFGNVTICEPDFYELRRKQIFVFIATKTYEKTITQQLETNFFEEGVDFLSISQFQERVLNILRNEA